jgi:predicted ATPase
MELGLKSSRELGHPPTVLHALWHAAELHHIRREPEAVEGVAQEVFALATKHGSAVVLANAMMMRAWAKVMRGMTEDGVAELQEGLSQWRSTGSHYHVPYRLARAADALRIAGHSEKASSLVGEALGIVESSGDRWYEAELHRLRGDLLPAVKYQEREAAFQRAFDLSRAQGAKLFELRAAASLAQLWHKNKQPAEAHAVLAAAYDWFTEGLATPDLRAARTLLETLR